MAFNAEIVQNAEVSVKLPPEKTPLEQLEIMEKYTKTHNEYLGKSKEAREIACLSVLYPALFRSIEDRDLIAGRIDFLPIGFGCVTSLGGVGHYCVFSKLKNLKNQLPESEHYRIDALYDYWLDHDLKSKYCREVLTDDTIGMFIDCEYPLIATARLSGMMLDYKTLMREGIPGIRERICKMQKQNGDNEFYRACLKALDLFVSCADALIEQIDRLIKTAGHERKKELNLMRDSLTYIKTAPPSTFHQALQLFWLYALLAGVINYGRMDDVLGTYLANDLREGRLTHDEAYRYLVSLWTLIENRRTTVNGRIIVGGKGRENPEDADVFVRLAMEVAKNCHYVEPQFTLRMDKDTPEDIFDLALDAIGTGATYPTLYNDDVNVPAVQYGMRVDEATAMQYVPFGCGEFVIQGQSVGTPNTCVNILKLLQIAINNGIDPMDGKRKNGPVELKPAEEITSYEELVEQYQRVLDYYFDLSVMAQTKSYEIMNNEVSFLFTSILMDDCIEKGRALLDGGVRYLGGTNEIYGLINASDSLCAIKKLVFEEKKYTLAELRDAANNDFLGNEVMRQALWRCPKYGNDNKEADTIANELYEYVAKGIRDRGIDAGMQYYLIVISNNQLNTDWGKCTAASYDGRRSRQYMNPANNPQGGANKNGPTAMLNSLSKFDAKYHGGSVQNMRFTPTLFNGSREKIKVMLKTYFARGGCHIMITVISRGILEEAQKDPEHHRDLIVRVSGFSAVFVNLDKDVQEEVMSRVLYG